MDRRPGTLIRRSSPARRAAWILAATTLVAGWAEPAAAQIDPMLIVKRSIASFTSVDYRAHVLLAVDASERMQWGYIANTGTDPAQIANDQTLAVSTSELQNRYTRAYFDPYDYSCAGDAWLVSLNLSGCVSGTKYRRRYEGLSATHAEATRITAVPATSAEYAYFYDRSRLGAARRALIKAVQDSSTSARFGLIRTRQSLGTAPSAASVAVTEQPTNTDGGFGSVLWKIMRPPAIVNDTSLGTVTTPLVKADVSTANSDVLTVLQRDPATSGSIVGAGNDTNTFEDAPLETLLEDAKAEAQRLITADVRTRNTVVILVTGGRENTLGHSPTATALAATFKSIGSRRVPIYVIGVEPSSGINNSASDTDTELQAIADASGGKYVRISAAEIEYAAQAHVPVPRLVAAINMAIQHAYADPADVNATPTLAPFGPKTEFQVTSPIVGTVDLYRASFADGTGVPDSESRITSQTGTELPLRSNLLVTSGFSLPGFEGMIRGFRVYKPVPDSTKPSGYKFVADGKKLWDAKPPMTAGGSVDGARRNIFTALADGTMVEFTEGNSAQLAHAMRLDSFPSGVSDAVKAAMVRQAIYEIRNLPLGPVVSSTPAILDPPSVDPPPDDEYPLFIDENKERRTLVIVGANDGMIHAFDGRTGLEVWAFIPYNLLPKMNALRYGQPVDGFVYTMDGSPKVADVKVNISGTETWRTNLVMGEGPGGTFYQAFDVTMPDLGNCVAKDENASESTLLGCFSNATRIPLKWSFPNTSHFDPSLGTFGDLLATATDVEKTVGQTWSDPAVGQIENQDGTYAVLAGSGFFPRTAEQSASRAGASAGRAFYLIDINSGAVTDYKDVGSDNKAETVDNCATSSPKGCSELKNALQGDPVATGPPDSRFITKAYLGDLDGNVWRFDIGMVSGMPKFKANPSKLYAAGGDQPLFASMAAVTVGTQQYLFFGGGSDLLPTPGVSGSYKLFGILEGQSTPTFTYSLAKTDGTDPDEKVSAFPAVAGDIVFFSTTSLKPQTPSAKPDANLYAFTFVGGAAYDSNGDNKIGKNESPQIVSLTGTGRATAPFIVDQHLWFGSGAKVSSFGDPQDFNNGVGQMGVRILSWRQVR
jgi:hypothetical protein